MTFKSCDKKHMLTLLTKMTTSLITALSILTEPVRETRLAGVTPQEALLSALQQNQLKLREQLSAVKELDEARRLLEEAREEVVWFCADTEDFTWSFVQECLTLLYCLAQHLSQLLEAFTQSQASASAKPHPPDAAPPLPPDVLSIAQQKTLSAVLQFLITLGLCPYLAPGVGVSLGLRSAFGTAVDRAVRHEVLPPCERRLLTTTTVLLDVSAVSSLATLVFTRHLGDLMAALCQLGYRPHRSEGDVAESSQGLTVEERKSCRQALQDLLGRVYQPIVIKELLVLQGGAKAGAGATRAPPWLRRLCGQLLSERLVQPQGVQAVVRAVLEGTRGGDSDWRKCDAIAKILATCPQQSSSAESYYSQVCPQVLELLHFKDKITAKQFQRVATRAALTMVQDQPEFAQSFLLSPLFSPLRRCAAVPEVSRVAGDDVSQHAVPEQELTCCVEDVYKICVVGNSPSAMLLSTLGDVFPVIFTLFCFTKQNVSHLRGPCQEILLWYLSHTEASLALSLLKGLCVMQKDGGGVTSGFQFTPGSEGGATLTQQQPISDEDDALYEKVSGEQWRVECVVQLLAELKDSDLPGELFLLLLHDLTEWEEEEEEEEEEVHVGTAPMMLLELEEQLKERSQRRGQRLALLHTLAVMCEGLPHTLLLRKPSQVVGFVQVMFQRAAVGLERGSDSSVDSQTLSLGMGLVAALLSGATELMAGDYSCMAELLTPLERLSQCHPDPLIQELVCDLRACIATRGAFRPASRSSTTYPRSHPPGPDRLRASQASPMPSPAASSSSAPQRGPERAASGHSPSHHTATTATGKSPASRSRYRDGEYSVMTAAGISTRGPASSAEKTFSDWLLEVCDPDVPTRTMALRALTQAVREGHKEALESQEKVLMLFLENLEHEDSFVYLSAIQGLVALADSFPEQILARLLVEYQASPSSASATSGPSLETRLKLGEALMRASRAMGDLAPHYGRPLIGAFLRGTRDEDSSVRASCLSNLGELCQLLHFSLGPLAQELSTCLTALIKTEREPEVRRAAVHVIALLLRGLSDRAPEVLGDILLELYRAVKWVVQFDPDEVAVLQAQLALEELDGVMRRFIFPQQKLEKKIVVLP